MVIPTILLGYQPTSAFFVFQMLSFQPLGLSFLCITWATILAPTTSLSFLQPSNIRPSRSRWTGQWISILAILIALIFELSAIAPVYFTSRKREKLLRTGVAFVNLLIQIETSGGRQGAENLSPLFQGFLKESAELSKWYRICVSLYLTWTISWVVVSSFDHFITAMSC